MRKIDFNFYKIYLWILLVVTVIYSYPFNFSLSLRNIIEIFLRYAAFIPFFGFAYNKVFPCRFWWKVFATVYLSWEMACYFVLSETSLAWEMLILIVLIPKYFSVIAYPLYTLEDMEDKQAVIRYRLEWLKTQVMLLVETIHVLITLAACIFVIRASIYSLYNANIGIGIMMFCVVVSFVLAICFYKMLGFGLVFLMQLLTIVIFTIAFNALTDDPSKYTYKTDVRIVEQIIGSMPADRISN